MNSVQKEITAEVIKCLGLVAFGYVCLCLFFTWQVAEGYVPQTGYMPVWHWPIKIIVALKGM